ncbi:MAG: RluA family pseudouridine synthase [Elusimicrobiota bacterium]
MKQEFLIDPEENGLTLSAVLRRRLSQPQAPLPWSKAKELCESGKVSLEGRRLLDPSFRVKTGQAYCIDEHARPPKPPTAAQIVFEDAHVIVIDKPAGVSSVPFDAKEKGTAMDAIREAWRHKGRSSVEPPLFTVHRIDKETSGLLAFAKSRRAETWLKELFQAHDIERSYLCVAHGRMRDRDIESMLEDDRGDGLRGSARRPGTGKRAVTHVRVLEDLPLATLCEVRLETGRTHQIRIHLSEAGHPVVGERVYIRDYMHAGFEPIECPRLLLHAATLGFLHPVTRKRVRFSSPIPKEFAAELERLRQING